MAAFLKPATAGITLAASHRNDAAGLIDAAREWARRSGPGE